MSSPKLRPYQDNAGAAVVGNFLDQGFNRLLVKMPTGTGKTVLFAAFLQFARLREWLEGFKASGNQRGASMLVIAHREELIRQAQAKIQAANPGLAVSIEQADLVASRYSDVVIASIQTLARNKYARLERLLARHTFRVVVVDEAHHAPADTYRTVLARLGFLPMADASEGTEIEAANFDDVAKMRAALTGWDATAPKDRLLVGVTATPNRSDAIGLGCVFQTIAYSYGLKQAIADGYLVPIVPWVIETAESLEEVHVSRGDFKQNELSSAVNTPRRNRLAVDAWKQYAGGAATIAFTVDIQHAHDLAAAFAADGIRAAALSGETDKEERRGMLRQFEAGRLDVITNCAVLTEGVDLPICGCILHAKPTKSATLYEQMTGRGLRPYTNKRACIVLDLVDIAGRHSLQSAPVLYGLPPGLVTAGENLDKLEAELAKLREVMGDLDAFLETGRYSLEELRKRARTFDVFSVPDMGALAGAVEMNWYRTGDDAFMLRYPWADGYETIRVTGDVLGKYAIALTLQPKGPAMGELPIMEAPRSRVLAADILGAAEALGVAEAFIQQERSSVRAIHSKAAAWRRRPASPKQIATLARYGIPVRHGVTMGQASDAIDKVFARRRIA